MAQPILKPDQIKLLCPFVESESSLDPIVEEVRRWRRSFRISGALSILSLLIGVVIGLIGLLSSPINIAFVILGSALYLAPFIALPLLRDADYRTFREIRDVLPKVDKVANEECKPMSRERGDIANTLMRCARIMRAFGARFPLTLPQRVRAREAALGSEVFKELVYPVMIGSREELDKVKRALALALLQIGGGNWVGVKALAAGSDDYPPIEALEARISKVGEVSIKLLPLAALIPPLIGGIIKYHNNIF
jgi:hypothetical protein